MSKGKIILGTMAGLAIGAAAGILFAPGKGSKTRRKIIKKGKDYIHGLKTRVDEAGKELKNAAAEVQRAAV